MTKKKKQKRADDEDPALPAFGGFHPLAGGLAGFKAKLDAEAKAAKAVEAPKNAPKIAAKKPPAARAPVASSSPADDDLAFHRMMSGVTPLGQAASRVPLANEARVPKAKMTTADIQAKAKAEAAGVMDHLRSLVFEGARFEVSDDGRRVEGRRDDVPPSLLRELRRGNIPIDARLDLHGLGAAEAHDRVLGFLSKSRTNGERCVLVIHGKGEARAGGGVLRGEISAWLSQGRPREHVAAFATARDEDGGEGAVYVALRR